ncbi:NAD-dependent epimerase/dehydratase family protein [Micromonospora olivasterospora]|uniref:Nucleoside-diphosphate-sugar epimerase n=1 Tax=Micromonospora olivasterospora TaxID=1880 RepID=A0A562IFM0_MICOL|nr:NAD-dependent epimerase/dehydratase family protein [Micromonospora olivasterospora]TWH69760.1 nucleoside-diphosphate-sugar epimerase [Micromonospora olivasterospora]
MTVHDTQRTVLVTGAAGFIGRHLVEHLSSQGRPVIGVDLREAPAWPADAAPVRHIVADLRTTNIRPLLAGVSSVVHLAALPGVRPSWDRFDEYVESNVLATRRLLEAATETGLRRLAIASSSSVYGNQDGAMTEDQPPAPISPYAVTKLAAEHLALAYAARPGSVLTTMALRFFTVYGPRQRPDMLISRIISAIQEGREIRVFGDGSQRRDFVFVKDAVRAVTAALDAPGPSRVCNVGTGEQISVVEIIALISELMGRPATVRAEPHRAGDVVSTRADTTRTARALGFRASVSLRKGLQEHINAARSDPMPVGA